MNTLFNDNSIPDITEDDQKNVSEDTMSEQAEMNLLRSTSFAFEFHRHQQEIKLLNQKLDKLFDTYNILSKIPNNLKRYGISDPMLDFIKSNFNFSQLNYVTQGIESLPPTKNIKLAKELTVAIEGTISTIKDNIIKAYQWLIEKINNFIQWIMTRTPVLKTRVRVANSKYASMDRNLDISNTPYTRGGGIYKSSDMMSIVARSKDYKTKIDTLISTKGRSNDLIVEVKNVLTDVKQKFGDYENNRVQNLGSANITISQLADQAFYTRIIIGAISNISSFGDMCKKLTTNKNDLTIDLAKLIKNPNADPAKVQAVENTLDMVKDVYNCCNTIVVANTNIVNMYCFALNSFKQV